MILALKFLNYYKQLYFSGIYGTLFRRNKEAAFSNYRLWESVGFVVAYAYSTTLCARMKLYVLETVLTTGFVGYLIVELLQKRKKQRQKKQEEEAKSAAAADADIPPKSIMPEIQEEDDEKDDIDDEIIVTQL